MAPKKAQSNLTSGMCAEREFDLQLVLCRIVRGQAAASSQKIQNHRDALS